MAWLIGYYSTDPNYPEGVRINVEALYEPPQRNLEDGFELLNDSNEYFRNCMIEGL